MAEKTKGLKGIVASYTEISRVDGEDGDLIYRGYHIHDLVENCCFEEVAHLVWDGELPNEDELDHLKRDLAAHRPLSERMTHVLQELPVSAPTMSTLRTCVSMIGLGDPRAEAPDPHTNREMARELGAQIASIVASVHRIRRGQPPVRPEPALSHAGNFLYMLSGKHPDELAEGVFDDCLILHIDHGFNASTFTGRIIASTLSDIYSAVTGAIGALRGPLHGGANQKVMQMLDEIGTADNAADHIKDLLAQKKKIMGFGHRVYKTEDPRATVLRRWARKLGEETGQTQWPDMQEIIEQVLLDEKGLHCNVDFYSASVYHMLGIPTDLFTPIFAVSRCIGWTAHILEQYASNRIIRPLSNYVGPEDRKVTPIAER
jgi:citrate synthase